MFTWSEFGVGGVLPGLELVVDGFTWYRIDDGGVLPGVGLVVEVLGVGCVSFS